MSWLAAGALSFLPHLAAILAATRMRPDFDHKRQFLSELGEHGSQTAALFNYLGVAPTGILLLVFGLGLAHACRTERLLRFAGVLIAVHGLCRIGAALFPCDVGCRPVSPSSSQLVHNATATSAFLALTIALFLVGSWLIKRRQSIVMILVTYFLGIVATASQAMLAVGSAGSIGLFQRTALGALQLWVALFSIYLFTRASPVTRNAM